MNLVLRVRRLSLMFCKQTLCVPMNKAKKKVLAEMNSIYRVIKKKVRDNHTGEYVFLSCTFLKCDKKRKPHIVVEKKTPS